MYETQNMDIFGLCRRMRRYRYELAYSVSSGVAFMKKEDADRLRSYLAGLSSYKQWFQAEPDLDLPESSPKSYDIGEPEKLPTVENESIVDLINMLDTCEHELLHSQSSRLSGRLISHDERRVDALLAKCSSFLEQYISQVLPLDLPESSPLRPESGPGRKGLNP